MFPGFLPLNGLCCRHFLAFNISPHSVSRCFIRLLFPLFFTLPGLACAADSQSAFVGIPVEFILFGLSLLGVALLHEFSLYIALTGLVTIALQRILVSGFKTGIGLAGFVGHLGHEWVTLANLFCLLSGFAILARHFEKSHVSDILPRFLPEDWRGGFMLLLMVFVLSSFVDNIAASLIGGAMAYRLFRARVHIGYLAAIVAASNAGGAGSVFGDTTTTMMWIAGVSPFKIIQAYVASVVALAIVGYFGARQQQAYSPIVKFNHEEREIDWGRIGIVAVMLVFAVLANIVVKTLAPQLAGRFPFIGVALWLVILFTARVRQHDWEVLPGVVKSSVFLLSLVLSASMMPVESLPAASWESALALGFISSVFDNEPLMVLVLRQGGYDWGLLAYAVGFGGSMVWFGSSAGEALSNMYPEAKSTGKWLRHGWHVVLAYVAGFFVLLAILGWHPDTDQQKSATAPVTVAQTVHKATSIQ